MMLKKLFQVDFPRKSGIFVKIEEKFDILHQRFTQQQLVFTKYQVFCQGQKEHEKVTNYLRKCVACIEWYNPVSIKSGFNCSTQHFTAHTLVVAKTLSYLSSCEVSCSLTILLHLVFLVLCNLHQLAQLLPLVVLVGQLYLSIGNNACQIKICNPFAVKKHKQNINLKIFDSHKMT